MGLGITFSLYPFPTAHFPPPKPHLLSTEEVQTSFFPIPLSPSVRPRRPVGFAATEIEEEGGDGRGKAAQLEEAMARGGASRSQSPCLRGQARLQKCQDSGSASFGLASPRRGRVNLISFPFRIRLRGEGVVGQRNLGRARGVAIFVRFRPPRIATFRSSSSGFCW